MILQIKFWLNLQELFTLNIDSFDLVGRLGTDEFLVSILSNSNENQKKNLWL